MAPPPSKGKQTTHRKPSRKRSSATLPPLLTTTASKQRRIQNSEPLSVTAGTIITQTQDDGTPSTATATTATPTSHESSSSPPTAFRSPFIGSIASPDVSSPRQLQFDSVKRRVHDTEAARQSEAIRDRQKKGDKRAKKTVTLQGHTIFSF
jgi:hypothetical protein